MIKPRLRLYICASAVAVALGGNVLTQAAGPREFLTRLWTREPAAKKQKESPSSLNPFHWFRKDTTKSVVTVSDGGRRVTSERPNLVKDPFLTENTPNLNGRASEPSQRIIVRPAPSRRTYNPVGQVLTVDAGSEQVVKKIDRRGTTPPPPSDVPRNDTSETRQIAASQSAKDGDFVNGFDSEFQKLFQAVVEESRQEKSQTGAPKLPDEPGDGDTTPSLGALIASTSSDGTDEGQWESSDVSDDSLNPNQPPVNDLIRTSRRVMESSVLAKRAERNGLTSQQSENLPTDQTGHDGIRKTAGSPFDANLGDTDHKASPATGFRPEMLPDQSPADSDLVVPSSMVPERGLFTTSDRWLNRRQRDYQTQAVQSEEAEFHPIVRVVPGSRGQGVVIESAQSSKVRSRVTSNVAPARSVPDTSEFQRLSFEGSEGSAQSDTVLALADGRQDVDVSRGARDSDKGRSSFMLPEASELATEREFDNKMPMMIVPDGDVAESTDHGASDDKQSAAPAPPQMRQTVFEMDWPEESEIAAAPPESGFSWMAAVFFVLVAGVASLFFRSKRQGVTFGLTGTQTDTENS